jgi:predicted ester cyclase
MTGESGPTPAETEMIKELSRRRVIDLIEAFYAGDIERALSLCSDDIDFFSNAPVDILPHLGHHHGKDDIRQMWKTIHERYSSMRHEMRFIVAEDDKVAVQLRAFFGKRSNQRIVQFDVAVFYTLRDRKIVKIREIIDTFDLIQQVVERDVIEMLVNKAGENI